jgi:PPM family protein phosphatase
MDLTEILNIVNLSDRGRRRPHNEDSSASDARTGLLVIADGMGGYKAGEVASTLAVTSIMNRADLPLALASYYSNNPLNNRE